VLVRGGNGDGHPAFVRWEGWLAGNSVGHGVVDQYGHAPMALSGCTLSAVYCVGQTIIELVGELGTKIWLIKLICLHVSGGIRDGPIGNAVRS
jgi:hypothetical protein